MLSNKRWLGMMSASMVVLATLQGCDKGEMQPTATPNVPAPGHGPSDGGTGNTPGESTTTGSDTTPPAPSSGGSDAKSTP